MIEASTLPKEQFEFLRKFCDFSDPKNVWILTGISRGKDQEDYHSFVSRRIITSAKELEKFYYMLLENMSDPDTTYRIYISLNGRNVEKAAINFQQTLSELIVDHFQGKDTNATNRMKKIDSLWKKELAQGRNRGTKYFMFDVDDQEEYPKEFVDFIKQTTEVKAVRRTRTGFAIVFKACDTRELEKWAEENSVKADLQRDSMVFVGTYRPPC